MNSINSSITTFLIFIALSSSIFSCSQDPEIITNTIIERDTLVINQIDTVLITISDTIRLTEFLSDTATSFILVRHAETAGGGSNPDLSTAGLLRAEELKRVLEQVSIAAVYSTNFRRTRNTAMAVANDQSLSVITYDPFNLTELVSNVLAEHLGKTVLVVGHSNTTPSLINELLGENQFQTLGENEYDNLFIVSKYNDHADVKHLKYGE